MGNSEQKIQMKAENAALTFPNIGTVFDIHERTIRINNQDRKLESYLLSTFDYIPEPFKPIYLLKYAFTYAGIGVQDDQGLIDSRIRRYIGEQLYNLLSSEFAEINRRLQTIESRVNGQANAELYTDISYCISRCAVLLDLFRNNLNYALGMATLFKQVSLVYITLGLALVLYDPTQKQQIINRFREIESCVNSFAEAAVSQRLEKVRYFHRFSNIGWIDDMRTDMHPQTLHIQPVIHYGYLGVLESGINMKVRENVDEYKNCLRHLYLEYFEKINTEALRPAQNKIDQC